MSAVFGQGRILRLTGFYYSRRKRASKLESKLRLELELELQLHSGEKSACGAAIGGMAAEYLS